TCGSWKRHADNRLQRLPDFHMESFTEDQVVVYRSCAGGGYGDPLARDPARVAADVNRQWLSEARAEEAFGVGLKLAANGIEREVDAERTRALRNERLGQ